MYNQLKEIKKMDDYMMWLSSIIEIIDTEYFRTTFFIGTESETIKNMVNYINYLILSNEAKLKYPKTYYYLQDIRESLEEAYENKIIKEETETLLKSI